MKRPAAAAYYGGQLALSALLLALIVPFGEWPLRVPFDYEGDGLIHAALVKGVAEEGPLRLTRIGAPFGADIVDWPMGMWLPLGVTSVLTRSTGHPGTALNLYWLLTIVLTAGSATWALGRLRIPAAAAFVFGLLYAFLPYVFYRNTCHFGTMYPLIPLVALLALRVAGTAPEALDRRERWVTLGACLAQGLSYVYYAFFGCILLAAAALLAGLRTRELRLPRLAAAGILLLALGSAIPLVPSFFYWHQHGRNPRLAYKKVADAEVYGLALRHLVTPIAEHPIGPFRRVAARIAEARFPLDNENTTAKLGFVGSVGFLFLVAFALARTAGALPPDEELGPAATLTVVALLVAQVGGLGSIFSVFATPDIRGYNRIVVFIAFFAFHAGAVLLSRGLVRLPTNRFHPWLTGAVLAVVCAFGVMDQVPRQYLATVRRNSAPQFAEDESFVSLVESRLPRGAMVFQLPHATIPLDVTSVAPMGLYDPGRAYLSSRSLKWSWGSIIGRTGDWQTRVAGLSPVAMTRRLALAGFAGIWIDRWGYGAESRTPWAQLEASLLAATGDGPLLASAKGRYSFLSLEPLQRRLNAELGPERLASARADALGDVDPFLPKWREGCSEEGTDAPGPVRVCGPAAWAIVKNERDHVARVRVSARFESFRPGRLTIRGDDFTDVRAVGDRAVAYDREVDLPAGHKLRFDLAFEGACETGGHGKRCLRVIDLEVLELNR